MKHGHVSRNSITRDYVKSDARSQQITKKLAVSIYQHLTNHVFDDYRLLR